MPNFYLKVNRTDIYCSIRNLGSNLSKNYKVNICLNSRYVYILYVRERDMPKAGKYDYPTRDLDDCVSYLQKAHSVAKEHVFKREAFADALEQSSKGGNFNLLVGSLSLYGLVETGDGEIRYTDLAKLILHGDEGERDAAKNKAARNIILFADIFDKFGSNPDEKNLKHFLRERAEVDIAEANSLSVTVGKLFKKVGNYIQPIDKNQNDGGESKEVTEQSTDNPIEIYMLGNGVQIKLPKGNLEDAWDKAKRALDIILGVEK